MATCLPFHTDNDRLPDLRLDRAAKEAGDYPRSPEAAGAESSGTPLW